MTGLPLAMIAFQASPVLIDQQWTRAFGDRPPTALGTGPRPVTAAAVLRWGLAGLAPAWYAVTTFGALDLPNFTVAFVLGVLVMLSVEPEAHFPHRGIAATRRNLVLALLVVVCFVPVAFGMNPLLGRIPIETGHAVLATLAAICVALPRLAETREFTTPAVIGHRELIIGVTALVTGVRAYQAGETVMAMVAFVVLLPVVMVIRRVRLGACSPRRLGRRSWTLQAGNLWVFLALLAAAALPGTLYVWRAYTPGAEAFIVAAFWVGLASAAVLVTFPRHRISLTTNVLAVLGSAFLVVQLVGTISGPRDAVTVGVPLTGRWEASPRVEAHSSTTTGRSPCNATRSTSSWSSTGRPTAATAAAWRASSSSGSMPWRATT